MEFTFKPLTQSDFDLLLRWLNVPYVQQFWDVDTKWTPELIKEKYRSYVEGYKLENGLKKPLHAFIIYADQKPIGYIQYYNAYDYVRDGRLSIEDLWHRPEKSLAALDFYVGEIEYKGKGYGSQLLRQFLKEHVHAHFEACLVDPDKQNKAAIKAYAKAGFHTIHETPTTIVMVARKDTHFNPIVILGSSRANGDTQDAIQMLFGERQVPVVDLKNHHIMHYDYEYGNKHDDFMRLAETMIKHNPIILATPVYWYTMSALMKTFIDRWSDMLDIRKDLGRRLAGKQLAVVASYATNLPKGFEDAFSQTCEYMEIEYLGCFYYYTGRDAEGRLQNSARSLEFKKKLGIE